jgi:hypothetical protein
MALKTVEDNQHDEDSEDADRICQHMRDGTPHRCHS